MGVEELQGLLDGLRRSLGAYEEKERELRQALDRVVEGRLMQVGAVRGVEMAIERLGKAAPVSGLPSAADAADESGLDSSLRSE